MIRVLHFADGTATVRSGIDEIVSPPSTGWAWIDMMDEDEETVRRQVEALGLDEIDVSNLMQGDDLRDIVEHPNHLLMTLKGFVTGRGERLTTNHINVVLGRNYLLTAHNGELLVFDWAFERMSEGGEQLQDGPAALLGHLSLVGSRRLARLLDRLEERVDDLEDLALRADPRAVTETYALRRDVILLRRALRPQGRAFEELATSATQLMSERDRLTFSHVAANQAQNLESLEADMHLLESVLETHRSATADQTNEIVRVLTVFSAVMLPLGLLAGVWGMNFAGVPGSDEPAGFWIMLGLMTVIAITLWGYFVLRGFVGAPRLREVPKSLGLGLIQVGVAPIKAVAGGIESTIRRVGWTEERTGKDETT